MTQATKAEGWLLESGHSVQVLCPCRNHMHTTTQVLHTVAVTEHNTHSRCSCRTVLCLTYEHTCPVTPHAHNNIYTLDALNPSHSYTHTAATGNLEQLSSISIGYAVCHADSALRRFQPHMLRCLYKPSLPELIVCGAASSDSTSTVAARTDNPRQT
jgi:hypothetical protein